MRGKNMTREEAIEIINRENDPIDKEVWEVFPEYKEALNMAKDALYKLEQIDQIINAPVYIQEDVMRYKMICEVIKDEK